MFTDGASGVFWRKGDPSVPCGRELETLSAFDHLVVRREKSLREFCRKVNSTRAGQERTRARERADQSQALLSVASSGYLAPALAASRFRSLSSLSVIAAAMSSILSRRCSEK